ncbi:MAG: hypothetical protein ACE5JZ_01475 [Kiloniellales bacterium]
MPRAGDRLLTTALMLLCVILAGVTLAPWLSDPTADLAADSPRRESQEETLPLRPPQLELPPIDHFAAVVERPIFTATRRSVQQRPEASPMSTSGPSLVLGRYRLTGVVVAPARRLVLLKRPGDNKTIRVVEGEEIDGWRLTQVTKTTLILESGGRREEFLIRDKSKAENRDQ